MKRYHRSDRWLVSWKSCYDAFKDSGGIRPNPSIVSRQIGYHRRRKEDFERSSGGVRECAGGEDPSFELCGVGMYFVGHTSLRSPEYVHDSIQAWESCQLDQEGALQFFDFRWRCILQHPKAAPSRKDIARTFIDRVRETMSKEGAKKLLDLYGIKETDTDPEGLVKICQFESDIGFFFGSLSQVEGSPATSKKYFQIFDLPNPFDAGGSLPKDRFATHTWDIVALLGCYDDVLEEGMLEMIQGWRDRILRFVCEDEEEGEPWDQWDEEDGEALVVGRGGTSIYPSQYAKQNLIDSTGSIYCGFRGNFVLWSLHLISSKRSLSSSISLRVHRHVMSRIPLFRPS